MSEPNKPKKEITMEQRLILAFVLMGVVLLVTTYWMPGGLGMNPAPTPATKSALKSANNSTPATPAQGATTPPGPAASSTPAPIAAAARVAGEKEETVTIETDLYKVVFSNRGAVARSWVLKKFKDSEGKPLELIHTRAVAKTGYPFLIRFHVDQSADALNGALYAVKRGADQFSVEFEYSDGTWFARKSFSFQKNSYLSQIKSEVRNGSAAKPHLLYWRGGFGDATVIGAAASQHSVRYDLDHTKLELLPASGMEKGPQAHRGRFSFAGIEDAYFAAVALPDTGKEFEIHSLSDLSPNLIDKKEELNVGVAIGGDPINSFQFFVGPKDSDLLKSISPRLAQLIDFGRFEIIAKPLFWAVNYVHDKYLHNYGWTIIAITIIINLLLMPLKITSLKSMKKMSSLQPQIQAINEKYRGIGMNDPRKQQQNQEMMDLYKKHGVNPAGGCLPMVLQIPFFIAFYSVLSVAIELRGADWLWVTDLSRPETLPIRILPIAMIATQFIMQKMTPATGGDPAQQKIMLMMPLFLGFMFYGVSSGLVLYWLTGNVVGIVQQWFFNRNSQPPAQAAVVPAKSKKKR